MPEQILPYQAQVADRASRASNMKKTLLDPFRTEDGKFFSPTNKAEADKRDMVMESAIQDSAYSMLENGKMIAAIHARALQGYEKKYGRLPADDLLASCHKAIENAILLSNKKIALGGIFENAEMSTTEGVMMRDRLISLVLPVQLQSITANMVTYIPGEFNQSEFFRVHRVAGSTFGSLKKGDKILYDYNGLYSVMDQRALMGKGDGNTKEFTFSTSSLNGVAYPIKPKRVRVWVDRKKVAEDTGGNGAIVGVYTSPNQTQVVVSGEADYAAGSIKVTFSEAPVKDIEIYIGFDVNIERDPNLIPRVDHVMSSYTLYPHESAITGDATIQAVWALRRELGIDIDNLTMQALRNLLAADKDRKHLTDMRFHAKNVVEWDRIGWEFKGNVYGITLRDHYESINHALLEVDSKLMRENGVSGLVGIVAGINAINIFRYLPAPWFVPAPGYRSVAQPHYVGRVMGQWDLYCNPQQEDGWECLCFARGPNHGETAYVAGDAVPALSFRHPILGDLTQRATMWDLAYRDMQPFDGEKYLCLLKIVENPSASEPPAEDKTSSENADA